MRAIEISRPGGPEVLTLTERPTPAPGPNETLLKVAAAGVNRPDIFQRRGLYPPPPGAIDLPGLEAAGTIEAVGADVTLVRPGDAVCALLPGGGYAQYALAHEGACLPVPAGFSSVEAAGLPETFFTVWANVFDDAGLRTGETLLVHGGTSGIGSTAIMLAKAFGATVIATASSDEKCASIIDLGADAALRYDVEGWVEEVKTRGGADVVLDMAGGDFVARNLDALNAGGRHVSIATLRGSRAEIGIMTLMRKRLRLTGSTMKSRDPAEKARLARDLREKVWPLLEDGAIRPRIDRVFPLEEAAAAHAWLETGAHVGKIILSVN